MIPATVTAPPMASDTRKCPHVSHRQQAINFVLTIFHSNVSGVGGGGGVELSKLVRKLKSTHRTSSSCWSAGVYLIEHFISQMRTYSRTPLAKWQPVGDLWRTRCARSGHGVYIINSFQLAKISSRIFTTGYRRRTVIWPHLSRPCAQTDARGGIVSKGCLALQSECIFVVYSWDTSTVTTVTTLTGRFQNGGIFNNDGMKFVNRWFYYSCDWCLVMADTFGAATVYETSWSFF